MALEYDYNGRSRMLHDEADVENLLSERLMEGFVLMEKSCPVCATPLVKRDEDDVDDGAGSVDTPVKPTMVPSRSFDQPFKPVGGVPFCVACESHVITQECEISILERCDSLKNKGSILVALQEGSTVCSEPSSNVHSRKQPLSPRDHIIEEKKSEDKVMIDVTHLDDAVDETEQLRSMPTTPVAKNVHDSHADEKKDEERTDNNDSDEIMAEYSVRREIATKVLGAKMLQGYTLKETQCSKCGMPVMEYKGKIDCVVCPALIKKAKKKMKAQQRLADEAVRLEREIEARKAKEAEAERRKIEEATRAQQNMYELQKAREKAEAEKREREREERLRQIIAEEEARQLAEKRRIAELEAEEARLVAEAAAKDAERQAKARAQALAEPSENEKALLIEKYRRENEARLLEERRAYEEKRKQEEQKLIEETRRLEELENRRKQSRISTTEAMRADLMNHEHRKRLAEKAKLDAEILRLEDARLQEEMETRRIAEERRAREEAMMIETLEQDAAEKARAAERAILKAKAALEYVSSARRDIIAQTIAMAEAEAIQEAENVIKAEREDYKAPTILPTASEIQRENWETLRSEGRSVMTRRVMAGWTLLAEFCVGAECHNSPLVTKAGKRECVVCGGCGNGKDGAYAVSSEELVHSSAEAKDFDTELAKLRQTGVHMDSVPGSFDAHLHPASPTATRTFEEVQEDFETKRNMVSKEIGKRMMKGWTLQDASCPRCVMPLMVDDKGCPNICVLCGLVTTFENTDGSTIQTEKTSKLQEETTIQSVSAAGSADGDEIEAVLPSVFQESTLPSAPTKVELEEEEEEEPVVIPIVEEESVPATEQEIIVVEEYVPTAEEDTVVVEESVPPAEQDAIMLGRSENPTKRNITVVKDSVPPMDDSASPAMEEDSTTPVVEEDSQKDESHQRDLVQVQTDKSGTGETNSSFATAVEEEAIEVSSAKPIEVSTNRIVHEPVEVRDLPQKYDAPVNEHEALEIESTYSSDLAGTIRRLSQRIAPITPKGDPPASRRRFPVRKGALEPEEFVAPAEDETNDVLEPEEDEKVDAPVSKPSISASKSPVPALKSPVQAPKPPVSSPKTAVSSPAPKPAVLASKPSVPAPKQGIPAPPSDISKGEKPTQDGKDDGDTITLSIPKNFDFTNEEAVKNLLLSAKNGTPVAVDVITTDHSDDVSRLTTKNHFEDYQRSTPRLEPVNPSIDEDEAAIEVTTSGTILTETDSMSPESILKLFMRSSMGLETRERNGKPLRFDEVLDLVHVFVAMNFSETVSDETKNHVAAEILANMDELALSNAEEEKPVGSVASKPIVLDSGSISTEVKSVGISPRQPQVINLEDYPTPETRSNSAFSFDVVEEVIPEEENSKDDEEEVKIVAPPTIRKMRPTPESMGKGKMRPTPESVTPRRKQTATKPLMSSPPKPAGTPRKGMPPRPDGGGAARSVTSPRNFASKPSPRKRYHTPRTSGIVVVGGPSERDRDYDEVKSVRSEVSRAETVASEALESILVRLEECKANLTRPGVDLKTQLATADLMEKLASAAVAMRRLEENN